MIKELPPDVKKYLEKYSTGNRQPEGDIAAPVTNIVVIPAIKEYDNLRILLSSLSALEKEYLPVTLFLFVINNAVSSGEEIKEDNLRTLKLLRSITSKSPGADELASEIIYSGIRLAFIDASTGSNALPDKDAGVGLARKTGMDAALALFDYSSPAKKILLCLDADCKVESNYLSSIITEFNKRGLKAAGVYFEHDIHDETTASAIICYEIFLRYFVLALNYAGSAYAYHTVGSTILCDYDSYIKAEGMNKRKAAEDFYFLQKTAKNNISYPLTGPLISRINTTTVHPGSRASWRVPFGTGQRVNRFLSGERDEYLLYDPECFEILKKWLNLFHSNNETGCSTYIREAEKIHPGLLNFLRQQNFEEHFGRIFSNSASAIQLQKQKISWFDAFRTMKLVHHLRDTGFHDINMFDALDRFFVKTGVPVVEREKPAAAVPGIEIRKKYLITLRKMDKDFL